MKKYTKAESVIIHNVAMFIAEIRATKLQLIPYLIGLLIMKYVDARSGFIMSCIISFIWSLEIAVFICIPDIEALMESINNNED